MTARMANANVGAIAPGDHNTVTIANSPDNNHNAAVGQAIIGNSFTLVTPIPIRNR
jgi:hypothetical protein